MTEKQIYNRLKNLNLNQKNYVLEMISKKMKISPITYVRDMSVWGIKNALKDYYFRTKCGSTTEITFAGHNSDDRCFFNELKSGTFKDALDSILPDVLQHGLDALKIERTTSIPKEDSFHVAYARAWGDDKTSKWKEAWNSLMTDTLFWDIIGDEVIDIIKNLPNDKNFRETTPQIVETIVRSSIDDSRYVTKFLEPKYDLLDEILPEILNSIPVHVKESTSLLNKIISIFTWKS